MRFHIFPSAFDAAFSPVLPMTGILFNFPVFCKCCRKCNGSCTIRCSCCSRCRQNITSHVLRERDTTSARSGHRNLRSYAASIACLLAPSGLALTNMTPSISPSSIFFASFASTFSASTLTSVKVP